MIQKVHATGKTIEEAVENGLKELGCSRDDVEVKIIEVPYKGFLGVFGSKDAEVELERKDQTEEVTKQFLHSLFEAMSLDVAIDIKINNDQMDIELSGPNMGVVIGKRGQTLDSIQYLTSLVVNKQRDKYMKVHMDTENYRQKREETLVRLAHKMAKNVKATKRKMVLEPMNPYERRIIHAALQSEPKIQTFSEGEEPYRKVAIALKK